MNPNEIFNIAYTDKKFERLNALILVAERQAEISFKAGLKETVEWVKTHYAGYQDYTISDNEWQAKLKEWGIE